MSLVEQEQTTSESYIVKLHREHLERQAQWKAKAVQDRGRYRNPRDPEPPPPMPPASAPAAAPTAAGPKLDSFIAAPTNAIARAAAEQIIACPPRPMFNPLYIHGGSGVGKTHLLQAIAEEVGSAAAYVPYHSIHAFDIAEARVAIFDDIGKLRSRATIAYFGRILDQLVAAGRQVVVAGDCPPADFGDFDEYCRSRLTGGLVIEIAPHDYALRHGILRARIAVAREHLPSFMVPDAVLDYVAGAVVNGHTLCGVIHRFLAHSVLIGLPVTMEQAEREVDALVTPQEPKRVRIEDIQRTVSRHYRISRTDILCSRRTANIVRPRQIAMYLAKTLTLRSLPEIGRRFGGRDHTTVLHAVRKIDGLIQINLQLAEEVAYLTKLITEERQ